MARIMLKKLSGTLLMLCCISLAQAEVNDSGVKIKWGYKGNIGPERWAQLDPAFAVCAAGKMQAPVSIPKQTARGLSALTIKYHPTSTMHIIENGTTTLMIGSQQEIISDGHGIQLNFPANAKESIVFSGDNYRLLQFHLHSPSENQWHGRSYPMEIHFVNQGENGKLLVMGVFVNGGKENPVLQKIIDKLPNDEGVEHAMVGVSINPAELLPSVKDYYSFPGSLTTPPCTEGVQWIMLEEPITASPAQILIMRKAMGGANARPVQPVNKREFTFAIEKK